MKNYKVIAGRQDFIG